MSNRSQEVPLAGPWESYHQFRLPFEPAHLPPDDEAVRSFAAALSDDLSNVSVEFRFAPDGYLQSRDRNDRPDVRCILVAPEQVYTRLLCWLTALGLAPLPPPFREHSPECPAPSAPPLSARTGFRARLSGLLPWLAGEHQGAGGRELITAPSAKQASSEHAKAQFEQLARWLEEEARAGRLLAAIRAWDKRKREGQRLRSLRELSVSPGGAVAFHLNGKPADLHLSEDGKNVTLTVSVPGCAELRLRIHPLGKSLFSRDLAPLLGGVTLHWGEGGVTLAAEEGAHTELACTPAPPPPVTQQQRST